MQRLILKLSGSALSEESGSGVNAKKVQNIAEQIKKLVENNDISLGIVIGAGNIWRGRDALENGMERVSADYMGMLGTIINSLALQNALEIIGIDTRVMTSISTPSVAEPYIRRKALHHLDNHRVVIFGGGTGNPFFSTDTTAALRAAEMNADLILMAKDGVDGVYNKDPKKHQDAVRYSHLNYEQLINDHLSVMDLTAATLCSENNIKIVVFDMSIEDNILKVVKDHSIGTIISK